MMRLITEFLEWNDNLYEIVRFIDESHKPVVDVWKEHLRADTVLRRNGVLFFCRKVEDAQIIEEEKKIEQKIENEIEHKSED